MFLISRAVSICVAYINFIALLLYEVKITFHGVCVHIKASISRTRSRKLAMSMEQPPPFFANQQPPPLPDVGPVVMDLDSG